MANTFVENVNLVANSVTQNLIDSAATVSANIISINTNATNIASINTNATNIVAIQNASGNASTATTQAGIATTQAGIATTQAGNALASANDAAISAASFAGFSASAPVMDGTATVGVANTASRGDHVHPSDTTKANLASPTFTGTVSGITSAMVGLGNVDNTSDVNKPVSTAQATADNLRLLLAGGTMTGAITALRETKVAMGANAIDLTAGNVFTKTISGATTLTVSGWLASGNANSFILELTNGGSAVVTWFSGVKWAGGTAPTLTASGVDVLGFYSHDGGTTVRGIVLSKDSK